MNTKSNTPLSEEELSERQALEARLAELNKKDNKTKKVEDEVIQLEPSEIKIQQDEYIPVMSLLPYNLNLSTKEFGGGTVKKFTKFGEVKNVLYKDLLDILEIHRNFVDAGYFYILDKRFIRQQGLDEVYSSILTKDKIEKILLSNSEESINLYNSANEEQKKTIVVLIVERIRSNPASIDLNIIDKLSRASKIDIAQMAEEIVDPASLAEQPVS